MKTFKQFLKEQKEAKQEPANSSGVLIHGNKIFVGVSHGQTPNLDKNTLELVKNHSDKHGHWNEGNGGDAQATKPITGDQKPNGSFDEDLINRDLYTDKSGNRFTPYHHLTNLFGNLPGSEQEKNIASKLTDEKLSLRDALIKHHTKIFDAPAHPGAVDRFLAKSGIKYQNMAKKPATHENIKSFLSRGTKDAWHGNENPDTGVGNMARKVQLERENYLLDKAPAGVYYIGRGHIPSMSGTLNQTGIKHELIGGSHAHL